MKAILFHKHGGPGVLEYADLPMPSPGHGEVLVKLQAAALNRLDLWVRNGWPGIKLTYPHIPLADASAAHHRLESGLQMGKITLHISQ